MLVSAGCSFTDIKYYFQGYGYTPDDHLFWNQILAEHLGLKHICIAKGGTGIDHHASKIADACARYGDEISTIAVGLSSWDRFGYPYASGPICVIPPTAGWLRNGKDVHDYEMFIETRKRNPVEVFKSSIINAYTNIYIIKCLAERVNAKLIMFQMLNPFSIIHTWKGQKQSAFKDERLTTIWTTLNDFPIYSILKKSNIKGFPFINDIGGYAVWPIVQHLNPGTPLTIGEDVYNNVGSDNHPNALGQRLIAEKVISDYGL